MYLTKNASFDEKKLLAAEVISRVTEPLIWVPLMIWLVLRHVNLPVYKQTVYYLVLLFFVFVVPFAYLIYLVFVKKDFDLEVSQRDKRVGFTMRAMVSFAIAVMLAYFMNRELFMITGAVFLSTLSLVLVTLRWKISFHSGLNTLIFCTVNYLYDWRFWWLLFLLVPIGWARLVMKKHSLAQLIAGTALSATVFFLIL